MRIQVELPTLYCALPLSMVHVVFMMFLLLFFFRYDLQLLDPLPGMDYRSSFGVVGPTDGKVRVQYKKRY